MATTSLINSPYANFATHLPWRAVPEVERFAHGEKPFIFSATPCLSG